MGEQDQSLEVRELRLRWSVSRGERTEWGAFLIVVDSGRPENGEGSRSRAGLQSVPVDDLGEGAKLGVCMHAQP